MTQKSISEVVFKIQDLVKSKVDQVEVDLKTGRLTSKTIQEEPTITIQGGQFA